MSNNTQCQPINEVQTQLPVIQSLTRTYCTIGGRENSQAPSAFTTCCNLGTSGVEVKTTGRNNCYDYCMLPDSYFAKKHAGANVTDNFIQCLNQNGGFQGLTLQCNVLGSTNDIASSAPYVPTSWFKVGAVVALIGSVLVL